MLLKRLAEIVGALTQFLEQSRVLDGDDGLLGEILDQCDLLVCERLHFPAIDRNRADQLVFLQHWHDYNGASTGDIGHLDSAGGASKVSRTVSHIMNVCDLMGTDDGGKTALRMRMDRHARPQSRERRWDVIAGSHGETVPVPQIHQAEIRAADTRGILKHLLEHRFQFTGR